MKKFLMYSMLILIYKNSIGQNNYRYSVDLVNTEDNSISVSLLSPKIKTSTIKFSFPKIIPGTYMISNYGQFISDLKAYDIKGKELMVSKINLNQWQIANATSLYKLTYKVEGIFDSKQKHTVFPMAATSFEQEDIIINTPGVFGYFDGIRNVPIDVIYNKPNNYYASTSMEPLKTSVNKDAFRLKNLDELYDEPIMYSKPDTATIIVGNCKVLFSVYSSSKLVHAQEIANALRPELEAVKKYLGGKLPANKYAFIYYLHPRLEYKSFVHGVGGALEHPTSSFYYLNEFKPDNIANNFIVGASLHEFFHIITPLTIASKEIKQFNFDSAVLSKHLWLYEGTTEYNAQYVQARYGLITQKEFLKRLTDKINTSQEQYNDSLAFTDLSKGSADKYNDQYPNVYEKGAVIAACVDIYLRNLSNGKYGLRNLTYELSKKYGITKPFEDDRLFDEIGQMTYPEIKRFLIKYVANANPIPYEYYFSMAGIHFVTEKDKEVLTSGRISLETDSLKRVIISNRSEFNDFGKAMGYKPGDIIYSFNGAIVNSENAFEVLDSVKSTMKTGDMFSAKVGRKNAAGKVDTVNLSAKIYAVNVKGRRALDFIDKPNEQQLLIRKAWLETDNDKAFDITVNSKSKQKK